MYKMQCKKSVIMLKFVYFVEMRCKKMYNYIYYIRLQLIERIDENGWINKQR